MKRLLLILLVLLIPLSYAVLEEYGSVYIDDNNNINVYRLKYEPYPAEPGSYVDVWIKLQNSADAFVDNVVFELLPKFPFALDSTEKAKRTIGRLSGGETALIKYKLRVESSAVEGNAPLMYKVTSATSRLEASLNIWVQTIDADIAVTSVTTERIVPGKATPVEIELENTADSPMNNVEVSLNLTAAAQPFIPVNSSSEKKIYLIEPNSKASVIFNLMALPGASADSYKIPIQITFTDGTGAEYTKNSIIGLIVGDSPDLDITVSKSTIYSRWSTGDVSLKIVNKGLSDVKLMNVVLKESPDYNILSEETVYLGSIDSDDYETADYRIKAKKVKKGIAILNIELDYMDANNNKYTEIRNVELKVVSAGKLGIKTGGSAKIIIIIIVIGAGFYFYRKWEKKKLSKK